MEFFYKKYLVLTTLLAFMSNMELYAQLLQEQDILLQSSELLNANSSSSGNGAYIQQIGQSNEVDLVQFQESSEGNLARVLQSGTMNEADIAQTIGGNQLVLLQHGNENYYEVFMQGTDNQLVAVQDGIANSIVQKLINSNGIRSELVQIGNNNEIIHFLEGMQNQEFSIRQIGDGLKVTIMQSGY